MQIFLMKQLQAKLIYKYFTAISNNNLIKGIE